MKSNENARVAIAAFVALIVLFSIERVIHAQAPHSGGASTSAVEGALGPPTQNTGAGSAQGSGGIPGSVPGVPVPPPSNSNVPPPASAYSGVPGAAVPPQPSNIPGVAAGGGPAPSQPPAQAPASQSNAGTAQSNPGVQGAPSNGASSSGEEDANLGYSFNPLSVKRDPFTPPNIKGGEVSDLRRYDLNEMNLVAILTGMGTPQAMIALPNGKTHIVQEGTEVGRRNGKVFKIKANEVIVKETFKDYQNRVKSDFTSLVIAQ